MENNDIAPQPTVTGDPAMDLQTLIEFNIGIFPTTTSLFFPEWCDISRLNLGSLQVSTHTFDFLEYRDAQGNALLRHTLGEL